MTYSSISKSLKTFPQVERRFEIISKNVFSKNIILIDDYGHHPTELINTINTIKEIWPDKEMVMAFQPHRYSELKPCLMSLLKCCQKLII